MLRQYEKIRREGMQHYGFGVDAMKDIKICRECGDMINVGAGKDICECGAQLPEETLYEVYVKRQRRCEHCETIVSKEVHFCPHCGTRLQEQTQGGNEV